MKFKIIGLNDRHNTSGLRTKVYTKDDTANYNDLNKSPIMYNVGSGYKELYWRVFIQRIK